MKRVFVIDGISYTHRLLREQGHTFALQFSDQDGNPTISDLTVHISDPNQELNLIEPVPQYPKLCVAIMESPLYAYDIFRGYIDRERSEYLKDERTYKLTVVPSESLLIDKLKGLRMSAIDNEFTLPYVLPIPRRFHYVRDSIARVCAQIGTVFAPANCTVPATWIVGGARTFIDSAWDPQLTAYDFFQGIAKLHNALWFFDGGNSLWFMDKRSFLLYQQSVYTTSLPVIKDSTTVKNNRVGYDYINLDWDAKVWSYFEQKVYDPSLARLKKITVPFTRPKTIFSSFVGGTVIDFQTDFGTGDGPQVYNVVCDYLLTGVNKFIQPLDPLGTNYTIEGDGLIEYEQTYSLIGLTLNGSQFGTLMLGYGNVTPPSMLSGQYFVRKIDIDSINETADITAIGYDI